MPDATISKAEPIPDPESIPTPPEEEFWEKYNKRLEFPLSTVSAVLIHVLVAALLIVVLGWLMTKNDDRSSVPLTLVEGGMDDAGDGSPGSGGEPEPLAQANKDPYGEQLKGLASPQELPVIKEKLKEFLKLDDIGETPIADNNAAAYGTVSDELKKKLLLGAKKGSGGSAGSGDDGSKGAGPGGTGASSSRARSLRWVMRFKTSDGTDYVNQLAAMGAVVLVPLPPENKQCLYFTDLKNPANNHIATDAELSGLAGQIKFSDTRPDSVRAVCGILGVREPARSFWAFFPKGIEEQLAQKETGYRNRRPEDIEETVFRVIVRGGGYEIVVDDQQAKR